eukprot:GHVO01010915.1.p2 GENE.GHVO01010915.1~~GHVO01010915.1.p2  ORF type:complete len:125 (+),score=4.17 GHVO01010915.1:566-940(+)
MYNYNILPLERGYGYVVTQRTRIIMQGSKSTALADETLSIWEGELITVLLAIDRLSTYRTPGQRILWYTDSKALLGWRNMVIPDTRRPKVKYALRVLSEQQIEVLRTWRRKSRRLFLTESHAGS